MKGKSKKQNQQLTWSEESKLVFERCKTNLINVAHFVFPKSDVKLAVMVDASNLAIGAVVQQFENNQWKPLRFFSRKLTTTEQRYSTYDRELLAAKHFIEGREFTLFSDHKPLVYALKPNLDKASPRQRRHLDLLAQFSSDIQYISGKDNVVADTLSRVDALTAPSSIDFWNRQNYFL